MERWWCCISCGHVAWRGAICRIVYLHAEQSEGKKGADHKGRPLPMGGGADERSEHSATRAAARRMEASSSAARGR